MPYPKAGDPYAPPGWKPPKTPPKVPPVGKGIGDIGSWLKGAGSKLQPKGIGLGKGASMLPMLGKALPWVGAAFTGYQAYNLAKQPMVDLFGIGDYYTDYQTYRGGGGNLSYNQWAAAGKPGKGVKVRTAADVAAKPLVAPKTPETPEQRINRIASEAQIEQDKQDAERAAQAWSTLGARLGEQVTIGGVMGFWGQDDKGFPEFNRIGNAPEGREPTEQDLWNREFQERELEQRKGEQEAQRAWWREQATMEAEQEKQARLAELQANPKSWLEYGLLAGQTPGIQPWMQPLMPQQYAGLGVGAAIPGYNPTGQGLGLPELSPMSRQYQARMGPTAQQQYYGYEQARTGSRPEETQFRLWSQAPPGGRSSSLSWMR